MPAYRDEEKDSKMQYWMSHKLKEGNDKKKKKKKRNCVFVLSF